MTDIVIVNGARTAMGGFGNRRIIFEGNSGLPLSSNGTFQYCSDQYHNHRKLTLSRMGHPRDEPLANC